MPDAVIFHITTRAAWVEAVHAGAYRPASLDDEGFIHNSTVDQVTATAARYYRGQSDLVLLVIDASRLQAELRYEVATGGALFPHIHGALNLEAVRQVLLFPPEPDGSFLLPPGIETEPEQPGIWIRAANHDRSAHWQHPALLVDANDGLVVTRTRLGTQVVREHGIFTSVFNTRAHYWPDRWFNVIRLELPGKGLDGFYCNIAEPLPFDGAAVRYVDLQLDVRVYATDAGLRWELLDEDEFDVARLRYRYSRELVERCQAAVQEVVALVEARAFPFDR
jgi:uncharacterized protein (DUF952 family)/protein associated with RNAse G/E